MSWLFGQSWLWYLIAFAVGVLLAWLLFVLPAQRRLRAAQDRVRSAPPPAVEDERTSLFAPATVAAAGADELTSVVEEKTSLVDLVKDEPEPPTEQFTAVDPALSSLDTGVFSRSAERTTEIPIVDADPTSEIPIVLPDNGSGDGATAVVDLGKRAAAADTAEDATAVASAGDTGIGDDNATAVVDLSKRTEAANSTDDATAVVISGSAAGASDDDATTVAAPGNDAGHGDDATSIVTPDAGDDAHSATAPGNDTDVTTVVAAGSADTHAEDAGSATENVGSTVEGTPEFDVWAEDATAALPITEPDADATTALPHDVVSTEAAADDATTVAPRAEPVSDDVTTAMPTADATTTLPAVEAEGLTTATPSVEAEPGEATSALPAVGSDDVTTAVPATDAESRQRPS